MKPIESAGLGEVALYESPEGKIRFDVRLDLESVWLTQARNGQVVRARAVGCDQAPEKCLQGGQAGG